MAYAARNVTVNKFGAIVKGVAKVAEAAFCVTKKGYVMVHPTEMRYLHLLRKGSPLGVMAWEHRNSLQEIYDRTGELDRANEGFCIVSPEELELFKVQETTGN